jgi:hypothetical protein
MVYALCSITPPNKTHISTNAHNLGSETQKATGTTMFMAIGQCGNILGSQIHPRRKARGICASYLAPVPCPNVLIYYVLHSSGITVSCGLEVFATVCAVVLWLSYKNENTRRNSEYGLQDPNATVDTTKLVDKMPSNRLLTYSTGIYVQVYTLVSQVPALELATSSAWLQHKNICTSKTFRESITIDVPKSPERASRESVVNIIVHRYIEL